MVQQRLVMGARRRVFTFPDTSVDCLVLPLDNSVEFSISSQRDASVGVASSHHGAEPARWLRAPVGSPWHSPQAVALSTNPATSTWSALQRGRR